MQKIASALVKAQTEMSNAKKGSTNPFFNSKYADLNSIREAVIPVLNANGIVVLQPTVTIEGKNYVNTKLMHESGEFLECFTEIIFSKLNDAQAQGSGISYARRYGLQSFVCIGADDDDGNKAVAEPQPTQPQNNLPWLNIFESDKKTPTREWNRLIALRQSNQPINITEIRKLFKISKAVESEINNLINS
jgi:hypothetical protein